MLTNVMFTLLSTGLPLASVRFTETVVLLRVLAITSFITVRKVFTSAAL